MTNIIKEEIYHENDDNDDDDAVPTWRTTSHLTTT